jgi:CheY-like chemotaxis protein
MNYDVIQCYDGIDILNEVINDQKRIKSLIDLIITDENMDFINGTDAIALLRKLEHTKKIRVPHIVSSTTEAYIEEKMEILKVYKIISKPVNKNSLINLLEGLSIL